MIERLSKYEFVERYKRYRGSEEFTNEALMKIFEYYEDYTEETGEEVEFDPIAISEEWAEYENMKELKKDYDLSDCSYICKLDNGHILIMVE